MVGPSVRQRIAIKLGELNLPLCDALAARFRGRGVEVEDRVSPARDDFERATGRNVSRQEIADHLGIDQRHNAESIIAGAGFRPPSLDGPVGDPTTLGSCIPDDQDIATQVTDHLALQWTLAGLTLREQRVVVWRFQEECTQIEIADRLALSQMQVSRILHRIFDNAGRLLNAAPNTNGTSNRRSPRRRASSLDVSPIVEGSSEPPIHSRNESIATLVFSGQTG